MRCKDTSTVIARVIQLTPVSCTIYFRLGGWCHQDTQSSAEGLASLSTATHRRASASSSQARPHLKRRRPHRHSAVVNAVHWPGRTSAISEAHSYWWDFSLRWHQGDKACSSSLLARWQHWKHRQTWKRRASSYYRRLHREEGAQENKWLVAGD